jgi:hypothetical protein
MSCSGVRPARGMLFMAMISSPAEMPARWVDAAREDGNDAAEAFRFAALHAAELGELIGVEESGVGIEAAEHAGNDAAVESFFALDGIGGVFADEGVDVKDFLDSIFEFLLLRGAEQGESGEKEDEAKHCYLE